MPENLELETREFIFRAASIDTDRREIVGTAVPYNQDANIGGWYIERFAPGAVQDSSDARLFWRHRDPIGLLSADESTDGGWEIRARISKTTLGNDALILASDGVVGHLSVGFEPGGEYEVEERENEVPVITRTKVRVREVSLVPFPAYEGAQVTEVREAAPTPPKENNPMPETEDLLEIRETVEDLQRQFALIPSAPAAPEPIETRSAGEILQALVRGDEATIAMYSETLERAYSGGTTADSINRVAWVGDLTRLVDEAAVLADLFSTGTLPESGLKLEYGKLADDTTTVEQQKKEGDNLAFGKVSLTVDHADIETFGGYTSLSRKEIERSSVNILDTNLRAMAIAAGKRRNISFRAFYAKLVAEQIAAGNTVAVADETKYISWVSAIVDAAERYTDLGLALENMVVDKTNFIKLASLEASDGRPLMTVAGTGTNVVGSLNVKGISGELASVPIKLNPKQATPGAAFTNKQAIRAYNSPLARLQDENVVNLTKDFSVYFYSALAAELPQAVVPITFGAGK
ncbi:HK97 family phage prohead protease [Plantibacter sp. YIM 135347]|uniref:HK97 family phage prohead protease n=1 Tax=Plantibacter sp. YIM 135347 TaxID=3423919 RepID=UPI003D341BB0